MKRAAVLLVCTALVTACRDHPPLSPPKPSNLISDAAHDVNVEHFFFLPPMVASPTPTGPFNPFLSPKVIIDQLELVVNGTVVCAATTITTFTMTTGPGSETVRVNPVDEYYIVNWHTDLFNLDTSCTYRIRVVIASTQVGFADVDAVGSGGQLRNVDTGAFVPLLDGRTLPIKFRPEIGLFGSSNAADRLEATVTNAGGDFTTNTGFAGARFPSGWIPNAAETVGITEVVLVIERIAVNNSSIATSCLQVPLEQREGCYRFFTVPDLTPFGPFDSPNGPVIAGVCNNLALTDPQAQPLQLHRRAEVAGVPTGPVVALPSAAAPFITCDNFAMRQGSFLDYASRLFRRLGSWLQPRELFAAAAVVDGGYGGATDAFSRFGWARAATMVEAAGTDDQTAVSGTRVATDPKVCLTRSHPAPALLVGEPVTFTVMAGGGNVGGAPAATVLTGTDGCASAPWTLGPTVAATPVPNTLQVSAAANGSPLTLSASSLQLSDQLSDPAGDAGSGPDFVSASATAANGNLILNAQFAAGTFNSATTFVTWNLDMDGNVATGFPGITSGNADSDRIGAEYLVEVRGSSFGSSASVIQRVGSSWVTVTSSLAIGQGADGVSVTVPLSLLGNDDGQLNFKATVQTQLTASTWTGIFDFVSNLGAAPGVLAFVVLN